MASKTQKAGLSGAVLALAAMIAVPFIYDREGDRPEAYQDVVGVWTICSGETQGVKPGDKMTKEQCRALTQSRVGQFMSQIAQKITVDVSPKTLAAHTSFAYNIGVAGYSRSTALALTNKGQLAAGCRAMMNWYKAGGRDCRLEKGQKRGCYGVIVRREDEIKLCLAGL